MKFQSTQKCFAVCFAGTGSYPVQYICHADATIDTDSGWIYDTFIVRSRYKDDGEEDKAAHTYRQLLELLDAQSAEAFASEVR